jgi:glycosyltransferase involved in cell wall biosynthesis
MKAIFLRGSVPPAHEHPEKLLYKSVLQECEDIWSQLFYLFLLGDDGSHGELLYDRNGASKREFSENHFTEKWVDLSNYTPSFDPDVIICRGGFHYYDDFVKRFPKAKKVYYGAGRRYWPTTNFTDYDLFLVDSDRHYRDIRRKGKNVDMLIKPAALLFESAMDDVEKEYDVCFMANASQMSIKRHELLIRSLSGSGLKVLNIGNTNPSLIKLAKNLNVDITWAGWHLRKHLPEMITKCRVGVCCSNNIDSCPRVIPEYLACNVPVVVTDNVNFWSDHYITEETGLVVNERDLLSGIIKLMNKNCSPFNYYARNLSLYVASMGLHCQVSKIL